MPVGVDEQEAAAGRAGKVNGAEAEGQWQEGGCNQYQRAEKYDLAAQQPALVNELVQAWDAWAKRVGVVRWEGVLEGYRAAGKNEAEAAG